MLAIALAIGLISALTGKDVVGDLNSGTIIDSNGLGGIIGGSGTSTGSGSSPETPGTSSGSGSSSGKDYIYKEEGVYYRSDLDIDYTYQEINGCASVVLSFYIPDDGAFFWNIEYSLNAESAYDNYSGPCCYTYDMGADGLENGRWVFKSSSESNGMFYGVRSDANGLVKIAIKRCDISGLSEDSKKSFVQSFMNSSYSIKVYQPGGAVG